jgi:hypothetical protein
MGLVHAGQVFLPKSGEWLEEFLQQLDEFPYGRFDDQVDAMVQYLGWAMENSAPASRPQRTMGVVLNRNGLATYPLAYVPFHQAAGMPNVWSPRRKR